MFTSRTLSIILLAALLVANNLHLPVLQVMAWCGMLVSYSRVTSVAEAVEMTFDGDHPCPMCKNIKKARAASADEARLKGLPEEKTRDICFVPADSGTCIPPDFTHNGCDFSGGSRPKVLAFQPPTQPPIRA